MDRDEFLSKLFSLYAATFNRGNGTAWSEAYKEVLAENIDYDKLYKYMLSNYAGASAPSPAFLSKNAVYKKTEETKKPIAWDETVLADAFGVTYEFALDCTFAEARTRLENRGLTNIRLKEPITRSYA